MGGPDKVWGVGKKSKSNKQGDFYLAPESIASMAYMILTVLCHVLVFLHKYVCLWSGTLVVNFYKKKVTILLSPPPIQTKLGRKLIERKRKQFSTSNSMGCFCLATMSPPCLIVTCLILISATRLSSVLNQCKHVFFFSFSR